MLSGCTMRNGKGDAMSTPSPSLSFLHTEGNKLVNKEGQIIQLRGVNTGCWLLIEPWIINCAWQDGIESEKDIWDLMTRRFGRDGKLELIKTYRDNFFTETDVQRIAASGLNCIRVPIWWRAIDDPEYGGDIDYLDRCIRWCEKNGIYVIIDLHGAPGGQSAEDKIVGEPSNGDLWNEEKFKQQTIAWWERIARRYKDNPTVAGYDLINEAMSATVPDMMALYDRIYKAVRALDDQHVIWLEDGLRGFHRMPHAQEFNWENVAYSFHYYPQDPQEAFAAGSTILHQFNRMALYYDVPILVGEFNSMHFERGGVETFLRYIDIFNYYGWSWTFWTYKKIENNFNTLWGLYGYYYEQMPELDLHKDSFDQIKTAFKRMNTAYSSVNEIMRAGLASPRIWPDPPGASNGMHILELSEAMVLPGKEDGIRIEWKWNYPNAGYWTRNDTLAFWVQVKEPGAYALGIRMANHSNNNKIQLWLDGIYARDFSLPNTGGWNAYKNVELDTVFLDQGLHVIELRQGDTQDAFINLQYASLQPSDKVPMVLSERTLHLTPVTHVDFDYQQPLRVEWTRRPPNFGYWHSGKYLTWNISLKKGAAYNVKITYATPNDDTVLTIGLDGSDLLSQQLPATGDWHNFDTANLGAMEIPPGKHQLTMRWETANPDGAGNVRELELTR